jgi:hypothetical protein
MKKYKFYSAILTGEGVPDNHVHDLAILEKYCDENPDISHRENHNGVSTFQIETDNTQLAVSLRLSLTETFYYTDNQL